MANSQYEDKDVRRVTRTRSKRCGNLELFWLRFLGFLLFLGICYGKNVMNFPLRSRGWDGQELIGEL